MLEALVISQILLWVLLLLMALMMLALLRQVGILHERIAPMGALTLDRGPKEGEQAPPNPPSGDARGNGSPGTGSGERTS